MPLAYRARQQSAARFSAAWTQGLTSVFEASVEEAVSRSWRSWCAREITSHLADRSINAAVKRQPI